MPEQTPNDFPERRESFLKEYKQLIDKYQCDFMSSPMLVPTPNGVWSMNEITFRVDVMDTKNAPTKSPLQFQSIQM